MSFTLHTPRDGPKKMIFYVRALIGNREAIEAEKKDFEHSRKEEEQAGKKGKKKKERERT